MSRMSLRFQRGRVRITDLADNPQTFPHFLNSAQVPIVAVTICAHRDIKFDLDVQTYVSDKSLLRACRVLHHTYRMGEPSSNPMVRHSHAA